MAFLTIFNTENSNRKEFIYKDSSYTFDFSKQSFFFATTESDKIFAPLRDRLVTIDFDLYNSNELGQIFLSHFPDISFDEEAINHLSTTFRGNARNCIHRVKDVRLFIETHNIIHFNLDCAKNLCSTLGILPEGLTSIVWRILNILRRDGRSSLQSICAKKALSRSSLQRDHENYLLSKGLMEIDGQRVITKRGNDLIYSNM
jgi:Holliday junction resolvasome RuvABC ATP-dependent DNA helicase subunit